jgi:acetolactate synthase I/II/III large subunit
MPATPIPTEMPVGAAIVWALSEANIEYVLTLPGGYTGPILEALYDHPTIRTLQVREESIATTMAEAYGRMTGRPIVVLGQGQWIAGNAGQGMLEALQGASPVVVLTEMTDGGPFSHHGFYQSGGGDYGAWDARTALKGVSKRVMVSRFASQAVQHTQLAIKHSMSGQQGPVIVIFEASSLKGSVGPTSRPPIYTTSSYLPESLNSVDEASLDEAMETLREASSPVIIAGNGIRVGQATDALLLAARALDVPVVTTASGKGVFPECDPLAAGLIGPNGLAAANSILASADVVLAVGTKLGTTDTMNENLALLNPSRQTIIQVDVEPLNAAWTYPVDQTLIGNADYVLRRLVSNVAVDGPPSRPNSGERRVEEARQKFDEFSESKLDRDAFPMLPQSIVRGLEEAVGEDAIITCDSGENRLFMMHWFRSKSDIGGYLQPAGGGGMSYSIRAALGAKLAFPSRPVIAVCGDGSFAMNIHALMTGLQEHLPIAVVVFNNKSLGWVVHAMGPKSVAADLIDFDHAAIARSLGCDGVRVSNAEEFKDALASAVAAKDRPFIIDVPTSMATSFLDVDVRRYLTPGGEKVKSPDSGEGGVL